MASAQCRGHRSPTTPFRQPEDRELDIREHEYKQVSALMKRQGHAVATLPP
jgi:hypothetical protein